MPVRMLAVLRSARGRRFALWARGFGIALLLASFLAAFAPVSAVVVVAALVPGLVLFLLGALAWLARDTEPWLRRD